MIVTVFTPTYNRAYTLRKLFESLCTQTCHDFEWLIVDDGSTDDTEKQIESYIRLNRIPIRYIKKENGGKHSAINMGVKEAKGELFFIVDSDDYLTDDAVEWILAESANIMERDDLAGLVGARAYPDGEIIGHEGITPTIEIDELTHTYKMGAFGDHAEVYKTSVLKEFPFPEYPGERFCSERLVWDRIATKYKLRYVSRPIYICEYLEDGLTRNVIRHKLRSPRLTMLQAKEGARYPQVSIKEKIVYWANYWRAWKYTDIPFSECLRDVGFWPVVFFPLGMLLYQKTKKMLND